MARVPLVAEESGLTWRSPWQGAEKHFSFPLHGTGRLAEQHSPPHATCWGTPVVLGALWGVSDSPSSKITASRCGILSESILHLLLSP